MIDLAICRSSPSHENRSTPLTGNCLARPGPVFQGKIEGSPLHMPKIGPWRREKPLISWEKLGAEALNNYAYRRAHPDETRQRSSGVGGKFFRFTHEVSVGDLVVYPSLRDKT